MKTPDKKSKKTIWIVIGAVVLLAAIAAIVLTQLLPKDNGQNPVKQEPIIFFQEDTVTVEKFETYSLKLQGAENKTVQWKSGNDQIATVQDGVICGWQKGNTQILARVDGLELSCNIIVTDNQCVPVIKLRENDELALDVGGTYSLKPVLCYNAKEYKDAQYTYSVVGNAVTVDENGVIQAVETGEAQVCVQGKWRTNVVEASLTVYVIDVSTSVEVSNNVFDIYLNGVGEEFPSSADLGIAIFEDDTPVEEKAASVKYIELLREGDVEGAAAVEDGVVYAKKIGTTHFVAEFTPAEGDAVRTTVFTVNVHRSPSDIYMSPIAGAEYEYFITPMNPINSVEWDESQEAFHLINKNVEENDGRAFLFSGEYIENILRYTNAKSIVFEVKGDGIEFGSLAPDQVIFQGFYPEWYDAESYLRIDKTDDWTKIEIFFDEIPLDSTGKRKSIMLLSTKEGMYVRNIYPRTEGAFLTMDLEFTTLGGNWYDDVEIGAYPYSYKGSINDYTNRVPIKAGVKTTVKYRLDDFLENGKVPGFGLVVFGGPEWDAKLSDGVTPDRHTLKITNLRVSGETNYNLDLSTASWATGKEGTGFTDANGSGIPSYEDGAIIITNGFRYDGHKFTLDSEEAKNRVYLCLDMQIDTVGGDWESDIELRFYPHSFEGNPHEEFADKAVIKAGKQKTIRLNAKEYLVNGELTGFGIGIFGGPTWDATLPDGYTPDRHTVTISGVRLEGAKSETYDLNKTAVASGTEGTGYTVANGSGQASVVDGVLKITDGFCYDCHKISLNQETGETEPKTYVVLDMQIDTLGGNWTNDIEMRFYPYNFQGNPHEEYGDKVNFKAGKATTVKLDAQKYLVDGALNGIGIGIFGGPEWNTQISDGVYDRHTVTISGIKLEGEQSETYDLSKAAVASGTEGTGYTTANGSGQASVVDGVLKITDGFRYDCHKISLTQETEPDETEPGETGTYVVLDMQIDTLGGDWTNDIEMRFYPYSFQGNPHEEYGDKVNFKAGKATTVKLDAQKYLVDGALNGIGIGIFGGPEWNTQISDGVYDRHTVTISGIKLEGEQSETYDLSKAAVASGTEGTGYTTANGSGQASVVDGVLIITDGFRYDCHKISLNQETEPDETEPDVTEPDVTEPDVTEPDATEPGETGTYVVLDMQIDTLGGNWTNDIEMRFYPYNFQGNPHEVYQDKVIFKAGQKQTVKLDAQEYLVDGKLNGIGIGIFGGPTWDAKLPDGYTPDRHTVTISGIKLEGEQSETYDLSKSVCISGTGDTGYTVANGSGVGAFVDGVYQITNGFCYDCHKISLTPETGETDPGETEQGTYVVLEMQIDTLGGNWTNDIEMRFYSYNFQGNPHKVYQDKVIFKAGQKQTVKLDAQEYLVDGALPGIGIGIFGGPTWDAKLPDGYTPDRHTVTVSSIKLEGEQSETYDLSKSVCLSGTGDTGYTVANGSGVGAFLDGVYQITNGFCYDCHKISLTSATQPGEEDQGTYVVLEMQIDTLGGNWTNDIEMRFYPYNFEGNPHEVYQDKVIFKAGQKQTVKIDAEKYLVDGALPGIGIGIFGGPEWNTQISNGVYDRHTVTISSVKLEGGQSAVYDLSRFTCISGTGDTGYTVANGSGVGAFVDGVYQITNGFRYDCHKITFAEKKESTKDWLEWVLPTKEEL